MKILIVNKFLFPKGGSETYSLNLGRELENSGHKVQYFGMEDPKRVVGNQAGSYTSSMDFHTGKLQKLLYPFKIIYSVEARRKIRVVLDGFKPDIVHLNNFNFQITPSVIYEIRSWGKRNGKYIPIVYTAHDYQWVCPDHMLYIPHKKEICFACRGGKYGACFQNKCIHNSAIKSMLGMTEAGLYRRLGVYGQVDAVICPSEFMKKMLGTNPCLKDKLTVMHNFIDYKEDGAGEKFPAKKDYVLYFGRYDQEKGIASLVEACRQLPHIPFLFAGSGEYEKILHTCGNIKNVGFQKGDGLRRLIGEAKFTVFPSEWYENCPFSVMESQACGTPVIASRIGGVPELLEDGVTGELFEPGNVEEMRNKISSLWDNSGKLAVYTENCRKKKFITAKEYGEMAVSLYKNLGSKGNSLGCLADGRQKRGKNE